MGEYIPAAPVNDDARKHNQNLPGIGGVFNTVNLHLYHYAGNNPVRYTDPDGRDVAAAMAVLSFAGTDVVTPDPTDAVPIPKAVGYAIAFLFALVFVATETEKENEQKEYVYHATGSIEFVEKLYKEGAAAIDYKNHGNPEARFGLAFYVAEDPITAVKEAKLSSPIVVKFSMDKSNILDLTDPVVAQRYGYREGMDHNEVSELLKGYVLPEGAKAIKYWSEENKGGVCYAVKDPTILKFEGF